MFRPDRGVILINDLDAREYMISDIRQDTAVILEHDFFIEGTIHDNVIYPYENDDYNYLMALKRTGLDRILRDNPAKNELLVNDNNFTADERRRIRCANAFFRDSGMLIIDNLNNGISSKTNNELLKEIYRTKNRIVIILSNDLNDLKGCERLVLLDNGKAMEYGTHEELASKRRSYYNQVLKTNGK